MVDFAGINPIIGSIVVLPWILRLAGSKNARLAAGCKRWGLAFFHPKDVTGVPVQKISLLVPLLLALSSLLHCFGMCGGIMGAMVFHVTASMQGRAWLFLLAANVGRLLSYGVAGALVATFGHAFFRALSPSYGHILLQGLAGLILVGNGLFLLGRFPELRSIEGLGAHLWRGLEPLARRFMTPQTVGQAFLFGIVWGWFPCSLVYGALLWSSASCSATLGALVMVLFGVGTLPVMLSAGWLTGYWIRFGGVSRFGRMTALLLLGIGIVNLTLLGWQAPELHKHDIINTYDCPIFP